MSTTFSSTAAASTTHRQRRNFWLRTLHQWHWISSAICLVSMLLFAATGLTLNHATQIETTPNVVHRTTTLPPALRTTLATPENSNAPLPPAVAVWLSTYTRQALAGRKAEWSPEEIYLSLPGPGTDAWLSLNRTNGVVEYEHTDRGWIAYFNDLHKGRNAGPAWGWFIDLLALACLVFCLTGLCLLHLHARHRRMTWPLVGFGLIVPLLIALLLIH
ncbi:MAG TPA: PepSY-associated TM helix domain-containing protein [Xylella sp.]